MVVLTTGSVVCVGIQNVSRQLVGLDIMFMSLVGPDAVLRQVVGVIVWVTPLVWF